MRFKVLQEHRGRNELQLEKSEKMFLKTWALKNEYNFERRGKSKILSSLGELRAFSTEKCS